MTIDDKIIKTYEERIPHTILATCLKGSQNYGLETSHSDVDTLSIVVPTLYDYACGLTENINKTYKFTTGQSEVKTIQKFIYGLKHPTIVSLEPLYASKIWVAKAFYTLWNQLQLDRNDIAFAQPTQVYWSTIGYIREMIKIWDKPTVGNFSLTLGYNPKAISHAFRGMEFLEHYLQREINYLASQDVKEIKLGYYTKQQIRDKLKRLQQHDFFLHPEWFQNIIPSGYTEEELNCWLYRCVKESLAYELVS